MPWFPYCTNFNYIPARLSFLLPVPTWATLSLSMSSESNSSLQPSLLFDLDPFAPDACLADPFHISECGDNVSDLLACSVGRSAGWMRLRDDSPRLCHDFHNQEDLHRDKVIYDYWHDRTLTTATGYIWVHGRYRLAAAAGLVGSKAMAGQVGTIKLIHDKY